MLLRSAVVPLLLHFGGKLADECANVDVVDKYDSSFTKTTNSLVFVCDFSTHGIKAKMLPYAAF